MAKVIVDTDEGKYAVPATIIGALAVNQATQGGVTGWAVTHIATGKRVGDLIRNRDTAFITLGALLSLDIRWEDAAFTNLEKKQALNAVAMVRKLTEEVSQ